MIINGRLLVEEYFRSRPGHAGLRAVERQFTAWWKEATEATWRNPAEIKAQYASASILRTGRAVFNVSGNRYRLIVSVNYKFGVLDIRFFGTHAEYDAIDAETV